MRFFELCNKIGLIVYLSVLWLVLCVPVITVGASTTAYLYVIRRMIEGKEGYVTRNFFSSFKKNFAVSTKGWLIVVAALFLMKLNINIVNAYHTTLGDFYVYLWAVYVTIFVLVMLTALYLFAYISIFEDGIIKAIKNSFLIAMRHLGYTLAVIAFDAAVIFIALDFFLLIVLVTPALIGYFNMKIQMVVFRKYMEQA